MFRQMRSDVFPSHEGQTWKVSDDPFDSVYKRTRDAKASAAGGTTIRLR